MTFDDIWMVALEVLSGYSDFSWQNHVFYRDMSWQIMSWLHLI